MAEPTAQQLARQRLAVMGAEAFAPKTKIDRRSKEYRDKERESSKRYRSTPKGKLTNSQKCMIYQRNHPEKVKGYVMRYQAKWKAAHGGINMGAWNYWMRRLDRGEITPEDVPGKYEICLNEWRSKKMKYHELKAYIAPTADGKGLADYYLKSEADKVIADLEESHKKEVEQLLIEIAELKQKLKNSRNARKYWRKEYLIEYKECRHNKYKRCLAMAKWCESEAYIHEQGSEYDEDLVAWFGKWYKRWLKIAEKFKEEK